MRALVIGMILFLSACNQGTTQVPYSDPALVAKVDSLTKALSAATHEQALMSAKFNSIQLIGPSGQSGVLTRSVNAVDFGPCPDAGIKSGSTGNGLDEVTQIFKQSPTTTCPGVYAEYDVATGNLHVAQRLFYTSSNCTGQAYVWDAGGNGIDSQKTSAGVAFMSPSTEGEMWVAPGTLPAPTSIQSAFSTGTGGCISDVETQTMWAAVPTDTATSGVPLSLGANYQLSGL